MRSNRVKTGSSYTGEKSLARVAINEFHIVNFSILLGRKTCIDDASSPKITGIDECYYTAKFSRNHAAVGPSAGKNDSIASSDSVTSSGVPKTVMVLMNDST